MGVDALYERIRDTQQVKNMAVIVVTGITTEGKRDILAVEPMYEESATTYTRVFNRLKEWGVEQVCGGIGCTKRVSESGPRSLYWLLLATLQRSFYA